uniref:Arginine biosynthesis bifunctional protein ArgJ n=1 Tax=Desulfobacca acetoxidans TaxID=60893 RepID=A0A7V6A1T1_9BACT
MIVTGFQAAGLAAGIKKHGGLDLALIVADNPAQAAGVFTKNRVKAAPVLLSRRRLRSGQAQAILINSGNANACNGPRGKEDARSLTRQTARLLGIPETSVLAASTGVIGQPLPADRMKAALPELASRLRPEGLTEAAEAILTTDTKAKTAFIQEKLWGQTITLAGMAKGAGMIHPDMATLLAFVVTDAAIDAAVLKNLLFTAVDQSFNRITIDGDTSTNDTVLLLASGRAGHPPVTEVTAAAPFGRLLTRLLADLAQQLVADGEGATRVYRVVIRGAGSLREARQAAATVATSPLVKTAMAGADVNWGRIMAALGRSGARFDPERVSIAFGPQVIVENGLGKGEAAEAEARKLILAGPITVTIDLGAGTFQDFYDTCDFTEDYIRINASYRS